MFSSSFDNDFELDNPDSLLSQVSVYNYKKATVNFSGWTANQSSYTKYFYFGRVISAPKTWAHNQHQAKLVEDVHVGQMLDVFTFTKAYKTVAQRSFQAKSVNRRFVVLTKSTNTS